MEEVPRFKVAALTKLLLGSRMIHPTADEESRTEPSKLTLKNGDNEGFQTTTIEEG